MLYTKLLHTASYQELVSTQPSGCDPRATFRHDLSRVTEQPSRA